MQPMKESIVTILHGIKAWGDARTSRLREELQRQIRAARQMAVAAKQSADNADKRIGQLWDGMDGAYEWLSELEARLNEELKLISHDTLQESVSTIEIPSLSVPLSELYVQAYIPGNPDSPQNRVTAPSVRIGLPQSSIAMQWQYAFDLGNAHPTGFVFARGRVNLRTGECESSSVHIEHPEAGGWANPYSSDTSHYYGPWMLDAMKGANDFSYDFVEGGGKINGIRISAGLGNTFVAGTEFLIMGR